jgi:hypothetical protein
MSEDMSTADIAGRGADDDPVTEATGVEQRSEQPPAAERPPETSAPPADAQGNDAASGRGALLAADDSDRFRARWGDVQTHFVDAPQEAVQDADSLVAELMKHLAESFARERDSLEQQWTRGEDVSTEDLRIALTRYRSFFDRLLEA